MVILPQFPDNFFDSVVTDPPYGLAFMDKEWDDFGTDLQKYQEWTRRWAQDVFRVLKPGGHFLSFGGTRTYHRMACGIEDAGFEIRDTIMWVYGSGFPKSLNIGKAVKKLLGNQGEWKGWGTALKPAIEPIIVARKPLSEKNVALNVLRWKTGGLNIDESRIKHNENLAVERNENRKLDTRNFGWGFKAVSRGNEGRFPANLILECTCDEVVEGKHTNPDCPCYILDKQSKKASRFFYCAKANSQERGEGNNHPTVKPIALMEYLVKMVTPPYGIVLDPFAGSGSTLIACKKLGFNYLGIEKEEGYVAIARKRLEVIPPKSMESMNKSNSHCE